MKIAVNTRFLLKGRLEGIGWYTYETLRRITAAHPEHEFYFLFDRAYDESFVFGPNVHPLVLFPQARHPFLWYWWFEVAVPKALDKIGADIFLSPDGYASLHTDVPTITVIHDLAFEHYPSHVPYLVRKYYQHYVRLFARKAEKVVTVSEFSKKDICYRYGILPSDVVVTPNGVNEKYGHVSPEAIKAVRKKYSHSNDYFVYAGNINPRKNLVRLMQAFDQFKRSTRAEVKLVIAGARGWNFQEVQRAHEAMRYADDVIMTGHLSSEELSALLAGSLAMVYISLFEGFGIPIIEAMQAGVPVITSNVSSMPEVAGDAAILVDPTSTKEVADALELLYRNNDIRQELIAKGHQQAKLFTWDRTADRLWKVLEMVMKDVEERQEA